MSATQSDLHGKMSKKIAQLTKVVYQLNTQNEDNSIITASIQAQHSRFIHEIGFDAESKIADLTKALASKKDTTNFHAQLEQLQKKHDLDKGLFLREFGLFKKDTQAKEMAAASQYEARVKVLVEEVAGMRRSFEEASRVFVKSVADLSEAHRCSLDRALHQKEEALAALSAEREAHVKLEKESQAVLLAERAARVSEKQKFEAEAEKGAVRVAHEIRMLHSDFNLKTETQSKNWEQSVGRMRAELAADRQGALLALERQWEQRLADTRAVLESSLAEARSEVVRAAESAQQLKADAAKAEATVLTLQKESVIFQTEISGLRSLVHRLSQAESSAEGLLQQLQSERERCQIFESKLSACEADRSEQINLSEKLKEELAFSVETAKTFARKMTADMIARDSELLDARGIIDALRVEISELQASSSRMKSMLEIANIEANERALVVQCELSTLRKESAALADEISCLKKRLIDEDCTWQGRLRASEVELETVVHAKMDAAATFARKESELTKRLDAATATTQALNEAAEKDKSQFLRTLEQANSSAGILSSKLASTEAELVALRIELAALRDTSSQSERSSSETADRLREELTMRKIELTKAENETVHWRKNAQCSESRLSFLESECAANLAENEKLRCDLAVAESSLSALQLKATALARDHAESMKKSAADLEAVRTLEQGYVNPVFDYFLFVHIM